MNFNFITRGINKIGFKMKKHAPTILEVVGVGLIGYGTFRIIKDSPKVEPVLDEAKEAINDIHVKAATEDNYSRSERVHDTLKVYVNTAVGVAKVLGPGLASIVGGTSSLVGAVRIVKGRNARLETVVASQGVELARIKNEIKEKLGEEEGEKVLNGIKAKTFEKTETDEQGNEVTTQEVREAANASNLPSDYYIYDATTFEYYRNDPWMYVEAELKDMRTKLERKWVKRGFLDELEILEFLGYCGPADRRVLRHKVKVYNPYISLDENPLFRFRRQDFETVYKNGQTGVEERIVIDLTGFVDESQIDW